MAFHAGWDKRTKQANPCLSLVFGRCGHLGSAAKYCINSLPLMQFGWDPPVVCLFIKSLSWSSYLAPPDPFSRNVKRLGGKKIKIKKPTKYRCDVDFNERLKRRSMKY